MTSYFQDIRSKVVLKVNGDYDIDSMRKQLGDYKEVTEKEYKEYLEPFEDVQKRAYKRQT